MIKKKFTPPSYKEMEFSGGGSKIERVVKNAKKHKYKYISPGSVNKIIGKWAPISNINFSYLLECFIAAMNDTGISIMNARGAYKTDIANSTSKCNSRLKIRLLSEVRQKPPVAV